MPKLCASLSLFSPEPHLSGKIWSYLVCRVSGHKLCTSLPDSWQSLSRFLAVTFSQRLLVRLVVQWKVLNGTYIWFTYSCIDSENTLDIFEPSTKIWQSTKYTFWLLQYDPGCGEQSDHFTRPRELEEKDVAISNRAIRYKYITNGPSST